MSLGAIGQYGSDSNSSISDSDEDYVNRDEECSNPEQPSPGKDTDLPTDPLSLGVEGSVEESDDSNSGDDAPPPEPAAPMPLPLPNIDRIVARNSSYLTSELVTKSISRNDDDQDGKGEERGAGENSVFFNPYKKAEEAKLAILKQHVAEFNKTPAIKEKDGTNKNRSKFYSGATEGGYSRSHTAIPPPTTYAKHANTSSSIPGMSQKPQIITYGRRVNSPAHHQYMYHEGGDQCHEEGGGGGSDLFDEKDSSILVQKRRKHKSGVGDSLTPPKKFMVMHQKIQAKERPWTLK